MPSKGPFQEPDRVSPSVRFLRQGRRRIERAAPRAPAEPRTRPSSHRSLEQIERTGAADADVRELVGRAQGGDDLAFAELYIQFFDRVLRYLAVALKNPDDAEEVAQEVFARALKALDRFDPNRGEFHAWLFGMVRNAAIDHLRRLHPDPVNLHDIARYTVGTAHREASLLERLDPGAAARSMIDELPETQRRVLALRFVFGLNTSEIADVTGGTPDTVRHAQHRALKALASIAIAAHAQPSLRGC